MVARYAGLVHSPDVVGGFASDKLILQFRSAASAQLFLSRAVPRSGAPAPANSGDALGSLRARLSTWGMTDAAFAFDPAPADQALSADLGMDRMVLVRLHAGTQVDRLAQELRGSPLLQLVEPVNLGGLLDDPPNDPLFGAQYALANHDRPGADVHAIGAWRRTTGAPLVRIAVLDTGISYSHPDIAPNVLPGRNFADGDPNNTDDSDFISHGTSVASIAGAIGDNSMGIAGLCWRVQILPGRIANRYGISDDVQCAAGLVWAADQRARAINVSLGYPIASAVLVAGAQYAYMRGALICAAAGNTPGIQIPCPARFSEVLCVGASDNRDTVPLFATTGPEMDLCAPGVDVLCAVDLASNPDGFDYETGTSMSCPFTVGAAALLWSVDPSLTNDQVKYALIVTADDIGEPGWDPGAGWGRLNVERAVRLIDPTTDFPCAVDWNHDGRVSSQDLFAFIMDYIANNADFNGDGVTTSSDFFAFVNSYFVGCG